MLKNIDAEIENLKFLETNFNKGKKGSGFHAEKSTKYHSNRTKSLTHEDDIFYQSANQNRRSTLGGPPREKISFSKPRSSQASSQRNTGIKLFKKQEPLDQRDSVGSRDSALPTHTRSKSGAERFFGGLMGLLGCGSDNK